MSLTKKKWNSVSGYILSTFLFWKPTSIESKEGAVSPQCWFQAGIVCEVKVTHLCPAYSLTTPWIITHQAPLSMGFLRWEYWSGLPFPCPGDLLNPETEPTSPPLAGRVFTTEPPGKLLNLDTHLHSRGFGWSSNWVIFSSVNWRADDTLFQLLPSSQLNKKHISTRSSVFFGEIRSGTQMPVFPHSHPTLAFLPFMFSHVFNGFAGGWNSQVKNHWGNSLTVQWLCLHNFIAEGAGSIPSQRTKILWATWHGQKIKKKEPLRWGFIFHETIYLKCHGYYSHSLAKPRN